MTTYVKVINDTNLTPNTTDNGGEFWQVLGGGGGGVGTVTSVSVVSANGFSATIANASSTPAITMKTTITGVLKGNGTAISAATAGTDYTDLAFKTISVAGQSDIVADSAADTLTLAGSGVTITTDATTDTITLTNAGALSSFTTIAVSGQSDVVADGAADTLTLAAGTGIALTTDATTDTVTIATTGSGTGDVVGPASATDEAVARFDTTTGKLLQNSGLIVQDVTGNVLTIRTANNVAIPPSITIAPGTPSGSSAGRPLTLFAGNASTSGGGGTLTLKAGAAAGANTAGTVNVAGGDSSFGAGGTGGRAQLLGGSGDIGGLINIIGGSTNGAGAGGDVNMWGGDSNSGNGGSVYIFGGDSVSGTDGHVVLGNPGAVSIQKIGSTLEAILDAGSILSSNKTFTFPNITGTFSLVTGDGLKLTDTVLSSNFTIPANTAAHVPGGLEIGGSATLSIIGILEIG